MKTLLVFAALLFAGFAGSYLPGYPAGWAYLPFLLPAICGAGSLFLLQDLAPPQRILPAAAGFPAAFLFPLLNGENQTVWETLFPPLAAAGIVIFLTGILRLIHYIRITLQKFRDIAAGKIPDSNTYEEK